MTEKDYLLLLKKQIQPKRVVCGFKADAYGRAVVTTGVPKEYKEGHITYEDQKTVSYESYMNNQFQQRAKRRR
ncbi:MAG: hypothetical protein IJB83_00175 [Bacilli bacterium]|nr:hypothetical protein [Bacilli bacterium]